MHKRAWDGFINRLFDSGQEIGSGGLLTQAGSCQDRIPLTRIDAIPFFAWDVSNVRHIVRVFLLGQPLNFFGRVSDKQLSTRSGNVFAS